MGWGSPVCLPILPDGECAGVVAGGHNLLLSFVLQSMVVVCLMRRFGGLPDCASLGLRPLHACKP